MLAVDSASVWTLPMWSRQTAVRVLWVAVCSQMCVLTGP
jgi:hypothetical protein